MKLKFAYVGGGVHPEIGEVLYRVQVISESPDTDRYQRYLANALGAAVPDEAACDRVLRLIAAVQNGEVDEARYDADEVDLTIKLGGVQTDIHANDEWVDNPAGRVDLTVWRAALEAWSRFLELPPSLDSVVEIDFPTQESNRPV